MKIVVDSIAKTLTQIDGAEEKTTGLFTKEAFEAISREWVRIGWGLKYYHNFSWYGLPILQLPEDLLRLQEVIYQVRPRVIVETGVYRGGSLVFHATLLESMGGGRVIGVDLHIPPEVRDAISKHPLSERIFLLEGDSTSVSIVDEVKDLAAEAAPVLVILDSGHAKAHVAAELECYSSLVTPGSYIVATDGIMSDLVEVPGGQPEWSHDNPTEAANEFAARHTEFEQAQPEWLFRDGPLTENVTYWPGAWLKRTR
jgi:cephalosporin hydroxylase